MVVLLVMFIFVRWKVVLFLLKVISVLVCCVVMFCRMGEIVRFVLKIVVLFFLRLVKIEVFLCVIFLIFLKVLRCVGVMVVIMVICGCVIVVKGVILSGWFMLILIMVNFVFCGICVKVSGMF